ncbi:RNA polymerase sigma factor [Ramlibacter sp. MMS24-I3-19]|uniref:RNA polymerase sigma factor n=1 Tax=Ramlibacter sp. MMS24-I3-19 TaxID=3416606 RepID=UPI003D024D7B
MTAQEAAVAAEQVARRSYGKLVAILAARTRDVAGAEDALAEAFASALAEWPARGVPHAPEGWLLTVARRRMVDAVRMRLHDEAAAAQLSILSDIDESEEGWLPDRRLGLLFACAHPGIDPAVRAPLMLQVVLGFDAAAIGSAFLVAPAAMSQRLVRAKAKIRHAGIPLEEPAPREMPDRLDAVLAAIYAAYTEGWIDAGGTDPHRRNLSDEALWLARLTVALLPAEPEALGLLSLLLHTHARRHARRDAGGRYVQLAEQSMASWDDAMIDEAEALLRQASTAGRPGRYQLEAAIQSAHAARRRGHPTDWAGIVRLYDGLLGMTQSPVTAINRAVALANATDARTGLRALEEVAGDKRLGDYQPYWAARADLLARCGEAREAMQAYQRAIGLEQDPAVRDFLLQRAGKLKCGRTTTTGAS